MCKNVYKFRKNNYEEKLFLSYSKVLYLIKNFRSSRLKITHIHTQMISWIYRKIDPFPLSPREKVFSRIEDGKEAVIFIVEIDRFNIYRLR